MNDDLEERFTVVSKMLRRELTMAQWKKDYRRRILPNGLLSKRINYDEFNTPGEFWAWGRAFDELIIIADEVLCSSISKTG